MQNKLKPHAYCLIYFGTVPDYVRHCIAQIKQVDASRDIYFVTDDSTFNYPGVIFVRDYPKEDLKKYFSDRKISLWTTSLQRVFALEYVAEKYSTKLIHFDCDVLIYWPFEDQVFLANGRNFITPLNSKEDNFSYFVMSDLIAFSAVVSDIRTAVQKGEVYCQGLVKHMPNEMALMRYFSMGRIQLLPTNPLMSGLDEGRLIFDAADYGFFIDGMDPRYHPNKGKGFIHAGYYTGDFLAANKGNFTVDFEEGKPVLTWKGEKYFIFNLHIHTKNLALYSYGQPATDTVRDILYTNVKTATVPDEKFPYRLGDAVLVEYPGAKKCVTHHKWRGTIGYDYFRRGGKNQDMTLLKELVTARVTAGNEIPSTEELVVHFRIGDWKRVDSNGSSVMKQFTEQMVTNHGLKSIRIVTALHNHALTEGENPWGALPEYVKYCVETLKANVSIKSSASADEDFVFLVSAKFLICSKGNFSRLAYYTAETKNKLLLSDEK
jgi:hypothetical protein